MWKIDPPTLTRVLIAEDEAIVARDLKTCLESLGYKVVGMVNRGSEVFDAVASQEPDVVLMDIILEGEVDGVEAAQKLFEAGTPVVFVTAHADRSTFERARDTHPFGYIVKPFESRELRIEIELALANAALMKQGRLLQGALSRLSEPAVMVDEAGLIQYANLAMSEWLGLPMRGIVGSRLPDLGFGLTGLNEHVIQTSIDVPGGRPRRVEIESVVCNAGSTSEWRLVYIRDITEAVRKESDILMAVESQKSRIGRELHDNVGQLLTAALLFLGDMSREVTDARIDRVSQLLRQSLEGIRSATRGLTGHHVQEAGLSGALRLLSEQIGSTSGAESDFKCFFSANIEDDEIRDTHLYRIAQEAASNAVRHASPNRVDLVLHGTESHVLLCIVSSGQDSDPADWKAGVGLKSMRERVRLLGGLLEIERIEKGQVEVRCLVPHQGTRVLRAQEVA